MKEGPAPRKNANDTPGARGSGSDNPGEERIDLLLTVLLVVVAVVAAGTTVFVIVSPKEQTHFTDFFILGENRTADSYPDMIFAGPAYPMYIGVGNHEQRSMNYTIETWVSDTVIDPGTNTTRIRAMEPGERLSLTLVQNETRILPYNLSVGKTGFNRMEFLLFNGTVPGPDVTNGDRINASYRNLNLWLNVRQGQD